MDGDGTGGDVFMDFAYYANDTVFKHTDALGRDTVFVYNFFRRRTTVQHPDGSTEHYVIDDAGNVIRHESGRGVVRRYEYEPGTRNRIRELDGFGRVTQAEYDDQGNMIRRIDRLGQEERWTYDPFGQITSYTSARAAAAGWGESRRLSYDVRGNLLRERVDFEGRLETVAEHSYDARGNRIERIEYAGPDRSGESRTTSEYDADGIAPVRVVDALGNAVRFERDDLHRVTRETRLRTDVETGEAERVDVLTAYDALDRVTSVVDADGVLRSIDYDADGRVVERRTEVHTTLGGTPPSDAARLARTDERNVYDAAGNLISQTDALGQTTQLEVDARDRLVRVVTPLGAETRFEYDADGNRVGVIDPVGSESRRFFDPEGRVTFEQDPLGQSIETRYDAEGRPTEIVHHYDWQGVTGQRTLQTFVQRDASGNPTLVDDAAGHTTELTYDRAGRLIAERGPLGTADEGTTQFAYDLQGRLQTRTDPAQHARTVGYDALGRVVALTDGLGRSRRLAYDELGNVVEQINAAGERVRFTYRGADRLARRTGAGVADTYRYDRLGRLVLARNAVATQRFAYDALDRPVSVSDERFGTARVVYDADGRIVQRIAPSGGQPFFTFPNGVVVQYQHDAAGRVTSVTDAAFGTWQLDVDAAGRPTREVTPGGVERRISYVPEGFVDAVSVDFPQGPVPSVSADYLVYDAMGNPKRIHYDDDGTGDTQIGFNARSFVASATYQGSDGSESFLYDLAGRRTTHLRRDGIVRTLERDAADQLVQIRQGASGPVLETFTHDAAGRRTRHTAGGVETRYTYDALDRLTGVQRADGSHTVTLAYTALGARYRRTETGQSDAFFFAGFAERRQDTGRVRLILGRDADHVLAEVATAGGGAARTLLPDAQGHVRFVAEGGALAGARRFEAFGGELFRTLPPPADPVERGYAGRPAEGGTGLLPFGPRHYDPATGAFLQPDPLFADVRYLYAYARHNPYVFGDPSGLLPEPISGIFDFEDFGFEGFGFGGFDASSQRDVGVQVAGGNEVTDAQALRQAQELRHGLVMDPRHPLAQTGFGSNRSLQTEALIDAYVEGYGELAAGVVGGPAARGAAGALARSPEALSVGARLLEIGHGFQETFDPSGVPSVPAPLPRAGSRYQQLGRGLGHVANYGPAVWGFVRGAFQ